MTAASLRGAGCLEWLRPAMETAAPAHMYWPSAGWTRSARVATRTPGPEPGAVKAARDFAGSTLRRWGMADLEVDVGVVVSELLTNALRHALPRQSEQLGASPIRLGLLYPGPCVLCAVADPSDQVPVVKTPDYLAETGRGLHVVASLCHRWGWTAPCHTGKVVWATFQPPAGQM